LRKLKLLGALLAVMAVMVSSAVSPAIARHWDIWDDPWGQCGWEWRLWPGWGWYWDYGCHDDDRWGFTSWAPVWGPVGVWDLDDHDDDDDDWDHHKDWDKDHNDWDKDHNDWHMDDDPWRR